MVDFGEEATTTICRRALAIKFLLGICGFFCVLSSS